MRILQNIVVTLDFGPMRKLFNAIYALGVRKAVTGLAKHPAVHSIYGCGSYFEGRHLAGHSDVDLGIVIKDTCSRSEGAHHDVARCYNRWKRVFPFLGGWDEKAGSLIFLEEATLGYPVLASFRVKMKQGRLQRLHGDPFPVDLGEGPATASEIVAEIDTLVRVAILQGEEHSRRLLFWKRLFTKLLVLADDLQLSELANEVRADPESRFLHQGDRRVYWNKCDPEELFSRFLATVRRICQEVMRRDGPVTLNHRPRSDDGSATAAQPAPPDAILAGAGVAVKNFRTLPSGPIGILPHLYYFSIDKRTPVLELRGTAYRGLRRLLRAMRKKKARNYLVRVEDFVFIVAGDGPYVDVIPLDPLLFANVHARLDGRLDFEMPRAIHEQQRADAAKVFRGLAASYGKHDGWITKYSYPCIYREDDIDTLHDTFEFLRSYVAHADDGIHLQSTGELAEYLKERHPECAGFLTDLMSYYDYLKNGRSGDEPANNLFRCLHQFVVQILGGASTISLDPHRSRLGITVGIITRNRAQDLRRALESLTGQVRPPDEIVLVDNGSTDDTRQVVEEFDGRLSIKYVYLPEASIPGARNTVIQHATQEIISFTDDDCGIPPEWLSSVERGFLRAKNVGIVGGWVEHWPAERNTIVDTYYEVFHNNKT